MHEPVNSRSLLRSRVLPSLKQIPLVVSWDFQVGESLLRRPWGLVLPAKLTFPPRRSCEPGQSVADGLRDSQTVVAPPSRIPGCAGADPGQGLDPQGPGSERGLQEPATRQGRLNPGVHPDHHLPPGKQCRCAPFLPIFLLSASVQRGNQKAEWGLGLQMGELWPTQCSQPSEVLPSEFAREVL